jgi:homoserine acetyltransferase
MMSGRRTVRVPSPCDLHAEPPLGPLLLLDLAAAVAANTLRAHHVAIEGDSSSYRARLADSFRRIRCRAALVASFSSDWLYPVYQSRELVDALRANRVDVRPYEVESHYGHDSFLLEHRKLTPLFREMLERGRSSP